jgi:hypothetical protein
MLAGSLLALFWAIILLIGAMSAACFVAGIRTSL